MMLCHHSEIILANLADLSMWLLYLISLLTASQVGISQVHTVEHAVLAIKMSLLSHLKYLTYQNSFVYLKST